MGEFPDGEPEARQLESETPWHMPVDYIGSNYKCLSKDIYGHLEGPYSRIGFFPDLREKF